MTKSKRNILVLVEGERTETALMTRLLTIYELDLKYEIVPFSTNIYALYQEMFEHNDPADMDLLQLLKSREPDSGKKALFDNSFSDILLIFDLDPHDSAFSQDKISRMVSYFVESSDMGKLYLNYPMVDDTFQILRNWLSSVCASSSPVSDINV